MGRKEDAISGGKTETAELKSGVRLMNLTEVYIKRMFLWPLSDPLGNWERTEFPQKETIGWASVQSTATAACFLSKARLRCKEGHLKHIGLGAERWLWGSLARRVMGKKQTVKIKD